MINIGDMAPPTCWALTKQATKSNSANIADKKVVL